MGLFKANLKRELQRLTNDIEKPDFKLPMKWTWWRKREGALLRIEREDIGIIGEIKKLYQKGCLNRRLTSEVLRLAIELRDEVERMRKRPDQQPEPEKIQHIDNLIEELDLFLNEELTMETLGIEVHNLVLYYGAATPDIKNFRSAEEDTIGRGIYLTDNKSARGYAIRRVKSRRGIPVIYEFLLHNLWLADLSNNHKVRVCFAKYEHRLKEIMGRPGIDWAFHGALARNLAIIKSGNLHSGNLRDVTFSNTSEFSRFLKEHGYDGLIAWEGGEADIGNHLSYVIFDLSKIQLLREIRIRV